MTTILALHAHPDDIETLAAGTLALLAGRECRLVIATMTAGECGATQGDPRDTGEIRKGEARAAAAMIGATYHCLGLADLAVFNDDPARRTTTEFVRFARPDLVLTASPIDYHPDHEAVSLLVRDACFAASAGGYRTGPSPPLDHIPHLYFMDPIGGRTREGARVEPDFAADVGAVMAIKRRMLASHQSQADWLLKQHGIVDFTADMEAQDAKRGRPFGVAFAEGFRQYRHHPYPRTPLLQTLLGEALLEAPRSLAQRDIRD